MKGSSSVDNNVLVILYVMYTEPSRSDIPGESESSPGYTTPDTLSRQRDLTRDYK